MNKNKYYIGDAKEILDTFPENSIHCVVTSPPYFNLRSYLKDTDPNKNKEIGIEKTPKEFIDNLVQVFQKIHRVLHPLGTIWVNIGDSYNGSGKGGTNPINHKMFGRPLPKDKVYGKPTHVEGLKPKDLIGIPWMLAFALREAGWYLRQDIIWKKRNPMPERVEDRCTKAHEYIFLLSKSQHYWFDSKAIQNRNCSNKRSIWTTKISTFKGAHFAVFPKELIVPCIQAGCPEFVCSKCKMPYKRHELQWKPDCKCKAKHESGIVLDPFFGSGTTGLVANEYGRDYIGIDLNPKNKSIAKKRNIAKGLFSLSDLQIKGKTNV